MSDVMLNSSLAREIRYKPRDGVEKPIQAVVCHKQQQSSKFHRTDNSVQTYPVEIIISTDDVPVVTKEDDFYCADINGVEKWHRVKDVLTRFGNKVRLGAA